MAKVVKRSVLPIYAVAAVWLIFGLFLLWSGGTMLLGAFRRPESGQTEE